MSSQPSGPLSRAVAHFERALLTAVLVMMMLVVALAAIDLAWIIIEDFITPPIVLLEIRELLDIFGFFLLLLIGIELLATMKAYFQTSKVSLDLILEVAIIAIARKVIVLEPEEHGGLTVIGVAVLVLALALAHYFVRRARRWEASRAVV